MALAFFGRKGTEQKATDTLLAGGVSLPFAGGEILAPTPTLATWYEVSSLLSQLKDLPEDELTLFHLLTLGEDAKVYARILACFLVGVRKDNQREREAKVEELLYSVSLRDLSTAFFSFLEQSNIQELFMLTTSLKQMKITTPTREVVNEATARGLE